ncbi:hypothetical protein B0I37DRAFT_26703 [Chaetomium sp. MPI-CAGE-AT-0009]|nr:hypothetical protein B0I37DRAFT_26703 [Chaetomium sp. MPI-CAGE-AT-0009]
MDMQAYQSEVGFLLVAQVTSHPCSLDVAGDTPESSDAHASNAQGLSEPLATGRPTLLGVRRIGRIPGSVRCAPLFSRLMCTCGSTTLRLACGVVLVLCSAFMPLALDSGLATASFLLGCVGNSGGSGPRPSCGVEKACMVTVAGSRPIRPTRYLDTGNLVTILRPSSSPSPHQAMSPNFCNSVTHSTLAAWPTLAVADAAANLARKALAKSREGLMAQAELERPLALHATVGEGNANPGRGEADH